MRVGGCFEAADYNLPCVLAVIVLPDQESFCNFKVFRILETFQKAQKCWSPSSWAEWLSFRGVGCDLLAVKERKEQSVVVIPALERLKQDYLNR